MVCISCIVIPVFLYLWHRFLQPIVMKFWPWNPVEDKTEGAADKPKCPLSNGTNKAKEENNSQVISNGKGKVD